ncbi:MAG: response regulator [Kofleriaceae bacterium]
MLLVVDDDEDLLQMLENLFSRAKVPHVCASSLAEVKALGDVLPTLDTALLDINLGPGQPSGVDIARWLREAGFAPRIIFITGHAPDHPLVKKAAGESGRVLEKPVIPSELLKIVAGS